MISPNPLKQFNDDEHAREAFKAFQINLLEQMAVDALFSGKSTEGFLEARKLITSSFDKLSELYDKVEVSEPSSPR